MITCVFRNLSSTFVSSTTSSSTLSWSLFFSILFLGLLLTPLQTWGLRNNIRKIRSGTLVSYAVGLTRHYTKHQLTHMTHSRGLWNDFLYSFLVFFFFAWVGLNRSAFDNKSVTFEHHIKKEHNMWNYLYFLVLLKQKDQTEFTGSECYVSKALKVKKKLIFIFRFLENL